MTDETFRLNGIPQETQAMIDAANARADKAEARAERAEAPFRALRNCLRLLMQCVFVHQVLMVMAYSMVMPYEFFLNRQRIEDRETFTPTGVEPQPSPSIPNPARPVAIRFPTRGAGYVRVDFINCLTGEPYSWIEIPDHEHTGIRIYDGVSSRLARGCPPVSHGLTPTRRVGFDNVRIEGQRALEPDSAPSSKTSTGTHS